MAEYDYSLEALNDNIYIAKTKEYFREVIQTYYSGAYRSCLVSLYSVVVCDVVFKLEELKDIYGDEAAAKILKEVGEKQKSNPKSPDWETNLIELVRDRTTLFELFEIEAIFQLQKLRHLSAHPVLTASSILFTPNKETVIAQIKNILTYVLTKPAYFSKKLANDIIVDVADNKDRLLNYEDLEKYLEAKYFQNARKELFTSLFKKLWKFAFKIDNEDCSDNREVNIKTLNIIYNKDRAAIEKSIADESAYYDFNNDKSIVLVLLNFLFSNPGIYKPLTAQTKVLIDGEISSTPKFAYLSWFKYDNFEQYYAEVKTWIDENIPAPSIIYKKVISLVEQFKGKPESIRLSINLFNNSPTYDAADIRFLELVEPMLAELNEGQLTAIISAVDSNSQINSRRRARIDNRKIRDAMMTVNPVFDFTQYDSFSV